LKKSVLVEREVRRRYPGTAATIPESATGCKLDLRGFAAREALRKV